MSHVVSDTEQRPLNPDPQSPKDTPTASTSEDAINTSHTPNSTTADDEEHKDDATCEKADDNSIAADLDAGISCQSADISFETSVGSVKSEGELSSDSESLELFQPSSPFKVTEEFLLPDIIEETEEMETDSLENPLENSFQDQDHSSLHSSLNDGELDIKETSFNEATLPGLSQAFEELPSIGELDMNPNLDPPMLPVSPPPGPLLSPELDVVSDVHQEVPYKEGYDAEEAKGYRHSVAGTCEDIPPPLPLTGPPGKMISPRHSRFIDLADLSADFKPNSMGKLDVSQLVLKMSKVVTKVEPPFQKTSEDKVLETESVKSSEILPPLPLDYPDADFDTSDASIIRQRLGSHHLKTFEPPKEFSDSGFQDTDVNTPPRTAVVLARPTFGSNEEKSDSPLSALTQKMDGSVTATSDEQLTENSSVGLKTVASSGSEVRTYNII